MYDNKITGGYVNQTTSSNTLRVTNDGWMIDEPVAVTTKNCKPYNIETFNVQQGDVILLHLNKDLDLDDTKMILEQAQQIFPKNTVLVANEHILKGLTILRLPIPKTGEVNMFDKEISAPDFLDNWLKQDLEL